VAASARLILRRAHVPVLVAQLALDELLAIGLPVDTASRLQRLAETDPRVLPVPDCGFEAVFDPEHRHV
jgi:hypothetical protein